MSDSVSNISAYYFFSLGKEKMVEMRPKLQALGKSLGLKGTILLSPEGINLFVAGRRADVESLLEAVIEHCPPFERAHRKWSESNEQPFNRWLVKIKREIITMGCPEIKPAEHTVKHLAPEELKAWLDEGRDVVMLDTRNDYEVSLGTFEGALDPEIESFRAFPEVVKGLSDLKEKPVVIFCTGGVRCEKAGPWMEAAGFQEVYQLEGGILNYFERCGGAHYQGECFVFDKRVAVNASLEETQTAQCYECRRVVGVDEQEQACQSGACPCGQAPWPQTWSDEVRSGAIQKRSSDC